MRLWHQDLIPYLPTRQLLGQHRECAALRGKGWMRKHATVDYVFDYNPYRLVLYHYLIINEMIKRGYKPDPIWLNPSYRGKKTNPYCTLDLKFEEIKEKIFPEHNQKYLEECVLNLYNKGITITFKKRNDTIETIS